jgi:two-component system phosphate regulon sensor histidine kinase PhoR
MVYGDYVSLAEKEGEKRKLDYWPKYEEGLYYFGVHFPGLRNFLLGEMGLWYFFTGILVLVIAFFGYSMMIILHQKRLSEVQRDFINNMSHEFRTPLTSIGLAADVITEEGPGGDPERIRKFSAILKGQTLILQKKVDQILLQASTERHYFKLNPEQLLPERIIEEVTEEFRAVAEHRQGRMEFINRSPGAEILADRFHFSGVLINLVDNALKYAGQPIVRITLEGLNEKLQLRISDNGAGIERKYIRKVFMPFFRVPSGNIHNVKGSGLGLSYVRKICDLHRWKIRLESEPGRGTTVIIIIPKAG